jgi:hypothetical protein
MTAMNLYRRSTLQASVVLLLAGLVGFTTAVAQRHKPHKLRATAVLEFSREGSANRPVLVPVTILDDGSFHDASIYKAAPEPMALGDGVIYEAQKTGQVVGYFTVKKASKGPIWTAMGLWAMASESPKTRAATTSSGSPAPSADERPIIRRPGSAQSPPATASPAPAASSTPATSSSRSSSPSDDRPVLQRSGNDSPPQGTSTPAATPTPAPAASAPEPEPDDPNRPTLRRRAPQSAQPVETTGISTSSIPSKSGGDVAPSKSEAPTSSGSSAAPATLVAVSDAQSSDSRSYEFIWKPGEKDAVESKMRRLALAQLPRENGSAAPTEKSLSNVVVRSFDLDLSNDAVMVLSAEVPPPTSSPASSPTTKAATKTKAGAKGSSATSPAPAPTPRATRYLTLIARVDIDGNPQKLASSVTDSSRLDVAPRLELIDAVDVDGDGLAELLFREYSFDDKSFVIFAIGRSTVTKLFEGASQPLK